MSGNSRTERTPRAPISAHWRKLAQARCAELGERLTPARLGAYAELLAAERPLTAYELITLLEARLDRKIAPPTVYRHLEFLTRVGLVHRIESTQSYLPCDHPQHDHESQYLLCSDCGRVEEVHSDHVDSVLDRLATKRGFRPARALVEVSGTCADCVTD